MKNRLLAAACAALALALLATIFLLPSTKNSNSAPVVITFPKVIDTDAPPVGVTVPAERRFGIDAFALGKEGTAYLVENNVLRAYARDGSQEWELAAGHANSLDVSPDGAWLALCGHQQVFTVNLTTREWGPGTPKEGWDHGGVTAAMWVSKTELAYTQGAGGVTLWSMEHNGRWGSYLNYDLMTKPTLSRDGSVMLHEGRKYKAKDAQYRLFLSRIHPRTKDGRGLVADEVMLPEMDWGADQPRMIFALRPDGTRAALHESTSRQYREYDVAKDGLEEVSRWEAKEGQCHLAYSPDGKTLAGVSKDGVLSLWDMTQLGSEPSVIDLKLGEEVSPFGTRLRWSLDGSRVGVASWKKLAVIRTKDKE